MQTIQKVYAVSSNVAVYRDSSPCTVFQAVPRHGLVKRRSFLLLFAPTHHLRLDGYEKQCSIKDVVTPYTHISEASRYILYTIILTFDGICTLS